MASKSPKRKGALQQAKEYLRINPSASNQQVVETLNVSLGTVSAARSFLVQTGVIPRSFYDRSSVPVDLPLPSTGPIMATKGISDIEREAVAQAMVNEAIGASTGEPLTAEEQRRRLSAVARNAAVSANFQLEIAAIQALARLDAQIGARDRLGPGPPLNDEDKIHRLGLLIEAVGKRLARKAWERAFGEQVTPQNQPQNSNEHRDVGGSSEAGLVPAPQNAPSTPEIGRESPEISPISGNEQV